MRQPRQVKVLLFRYCSGRSFHFARDRPSLNMVPWYIGGLSHPWKCHWNEFCRRLLPKVVDKQSVKQHFLLFSQFLAWAWQLRMQGAVKLYWNMDSACWEQHSLLPFASTTKREFDFSWDVMRSASKSTQIAFKGTQLIDLLCILKT